MSQEILISIITVVYNGKDSLEQTILSVLNQSVAPYEYLIIDGKSTDTTVEIAKKYEVAFQQKNIKYKIYSEKDDGIYDAMNKGIRLASGDFVAMLNSDDWYENTAIETVITTYREHPFDLAYGSIQYTGKNGAILVKNSRVDSFVTSRNWNHPSTFVRRELCLQYPFDLNWKIYADFDWFLKLRNMNINIAIFPVDKVIAHFRTGGASINKNLDSMLQRAREKYVAYRKNGYGRIYFFESYGWEFVKYCFAIIYS